MRVRAPVRHFSMIRSFHLADLITIANGFCGVAAIFEAMKFLRGGDERHVFGAAMLIPLALIFDLLDGRIARWRHMSSALGRELDSLADMISFGVAPAAIAFAVGLNTWVDQIVLIYFAICGLSRLARYNITAESMSSTGRVEYFEGTPIPTSVIPLGLLMIVFYRGDLYPFNLFGLKIHWPVALFFISGCLMISRTIRIPKP
ncbi:MAG: CDP-diacylglycerol--serine O-phosphatidyltransferase [Chloracidobacterium sp.]|nr:CDP-diacylglycerol--serine O-phosphatidyltransferase [Chloracidobacterium sp.]